MHRRKRGPQTTNSVHKYERYPNLLRGLTVNHPDQVWCADITHIHLGTQYIYLAVLLDVYPQLAGLEPWKAPGLGIGHAGFAICFATAMP